MQGLPLTLALTALVLGGIGLGTTEFVTMGLLPEIAEGIGTTIPSAGHTISAYAMGVVIGAPAIAILANRMPRREMLVGLMLVFAAGNALSAIASGYELLMLARFVCGIPHGAFFGIASIIAFDIVAPGRGGWAVSRVMLGIPVANLAGVPLATWLGQQAGWRSAYWLVAAIGVLTAVLVATVVPYQPGDKEARIRSELAAFRDSQVWLTLLVVAVMAVAWATQRGDDAPADDYSFTTLDELRNTPGYDPNLYNDHSHERYEDN